MSVHHAMAPRSALVIRLLASALLGSGLAHAAPALPASGNYLLKDPQTTSVRCVSIETATSARRFTLTDDGVTRTCVAQVSDSFSANPATPTRTTDANTALCAGPGISEVLELKFTARSLQEVNRLMLGGDGNVVASRLKPAPSFMLDTKSVCTGVL